jgi:hypothetical protein
MRENRLMRDPHVVSLTYLLVPEPRTSFAAGATPTQADTAGFAVLLADNKLTITMRDHYPSERSARDAVGRYLRAWEIRSAVNLGTGRPEFHFEFERSELVDRDPPLPGEPETVTAKFTLPLEAQMSASASVEHHAYPSPPSDFALGLDVETLWDRWVGYLERREPLQSMAYFCLTVLQRAAGGRREAASHYGVSRKILDTLAQLSEAGDATTARKMQMTPRPLTDAERAWMEAAVLVLIRRAGEVAVGSGSALAKITLADLPSL